MSSSFVEGNFEDKYNTNNPISKFLMTRFLKSFDNLVEKVGHTKRVKTICEIGCGEGELLKRLRFKFPDAEIHACDLSANEIAKAKKNCQGLGIHFSIQDAQKLTYSDKMFDLVIACEVLEHIPDPDKAISEIKRVGKLAIVSVPIEPLWRILNILRLRYLNDFGNTPGHLNHWGIFSFQKLLKNHALKPIYNKVPLPWQIYMIKNSN